jgi:hypothetical protein
MSIVDTAELPCGTQEEVTVPTMDAVPVESDLSQSMDQNPQPPIILVDMEAMHKLHAEQSFETGSSRRSFLARRTSSFSGSFASRVYTPGGLSFFTATCTVVNYLAAGYIILPWAFSQGGTLLTSIVLGAVVLQTYITAAFVLEACVRAQALELVLSMGHLPQRYNFTIRERKYELSLLTKIFLGKAGSLFFSFTTLGDLYGITWALCTIFASTFADQFPLRDVQDGGYKSYIGIFMVVAVPLSCTSITDQLWIQMAFMVARFVMVILMVATVAAAYGADEPHFGSQVGPVYDVSLAKPSNIVQVTMTCIFATAFQFSAPIMAGQSHSKMVLSQVFGIATTLSYTTNVLLAVLLALFFGQDQPGSSNLNWIDYHGGTGTGDGDPTGWATLISGYIVMFAAIDGVVVYSLIAMSTGEILMGAFFGDDVHEFELDWRIRTAFRLLGSIPQAIGAMFLSDLGVIVKYAGIFTVLSYTVCPSMLALSSRAAMKKKNLPLTTYYSLYFSSYLWSYVLIFLSALVISGVAVSAALE